MSGLFSSTYAALVTEPKALGMRGLYNYWATQGP